MSLAIKIILAVAVIGLGLCLLFVLVLVSISSAPQKPMTPNSSEALRLRRKQFQARADKHRGEMWKRLDDVDRARRSLEGVSS